MPHIHNACMPCIWLHPERCIHQVLYDRNIIISKVGQETYTAGRCTRCAKHRHTDIYHVYTCRPVHCRLGQWENNNLAITAACTLSVWCVHAHSGLSAVLSLKLLATAQGASAMTATLLKLPPAEAARGNSMNCPPLPYDWCTCTSCESTPPRPLTRQNLVQGP